ncbi:MAG: antibiotic biosynthesis monooxygenase [Trueperaceae bacterium]
MIIVSGKLYVDPIVRDSYLADCRDIIEKARSTDGCIDFHIAADPLESDRINVFEQWASIADLEVFRGSGPSSEQAAQIREAQVSQHEVGSSQKL